MKILKYEAFFENLQEEPQGGAQEEAQEAQGEPDFRKIAVPGTNLNLDEFQKRLGQPIREYELSSDGKQVTEINGRPIAQVVGEEFSEGEIVRLKESDALASAIDKAMIEIDDSMSYTDFALAVGKILKDQYGKHTFKGFTEVLHKDLGI